MADHLTIHRGAIVEPRHFQLVTADWRADDDTDMDYSIDGNPIAAAVWCSLTMLALCVFVGYLTWEVFLR